MTVNMNRVNFFETPSIPVLFIFVLGTYFLNSEAASPRKWPKSYAELEFVLQKQKIIPDVIEPTVKDLQILSVTHENGSKVLLGNRLKPGQVMFEPINVDWKSDSDALYTVMVVGPDVPTRENPMEAEFKHWLIGNIPGNNLTGGDWMNQWLGVALDYCSGIHRVVYLLFKQPSKTSIEFTEKDGRLRYVNMKRTDFSSVAFAQSYGLGHPIAVNFCFVKNQVNYPVTGAS